MTLNKELHDLKEESKLPEGDIEYYRKLYKQSHLYDSIALERVISIHETILVIDRKLVRFESGIEQHAGVVDKSLVEKDENFTFVNGNQDLKSDDHEDFDAFNSSDLLSLDNFFERPVRIATYNLSSSVLAYVKLDVWDLYTLAPSVRAKLKNYAFLKGDLEVSVHVSGTPYHSGRLLVSYQPFANANEVLKAYNSMVAFSTGYYELYMNYLSQSPECVVIDMKENKSAKILCPFIYHKGFMRLYNSQTTAISDVTSFDDAKQAGSLYLFPLNQLRVIGTASTSISLEVYARLINAQVCCPTGTITTITTESGRRKLREDESGPLEKITSSMATFLAGFKNVPYIGRYAKASSIVVKGVSDASAVLGWSKPIINDVASTVKTISHRNGATCIGSDTNFKLSIDPQQELTVDPSIVRSSMDDMAFSAICGRKSYLTKFNWDASDAPNTELWTCGVGPNLYTRLSRAGPKTWVQPTALGFCSAPFQYWHGEISFTFDIVASNFHRGKLAIFYEPNCNQDVLINASVETNKQYLMTIDLQETQKITVTIGWHNSRAWLFVNNPNSYVQYPSLGLPVNDVYNGYISLYPLTKLVSPDGSNVEIDVWVHSDNIMFNYPTEGQLPNERLVATSSGVVSESSSNFELGKPITTPEHLGELCFGEIPLSFRTLLKRYCFSASLVGTTPATTGRQFLLWIFNIMKSPEPLISTGAGSSTKNLFDYLRYAYVGVRGGVRYRITYQGAMSSDTFAQTMVEMQGITDSATVDSVSNSTGTPRATIRPTARFNSPAHHAIEVECPYDSANFFSLSFSNTLDGAGIFGYDVMNQYWARTFKISASFFNDNNKGITGVLEVASGEDFSFLRFQGAPFWSGSF